jgi:hypothetical protein
MSQTMVAQIAAGYAKLRRQPGAWVKLASLREHLGGARAQQDTALTSLANQKLIILIPEENQKTLRKIDREAAITYGGEANHLIAIEPEEFEYMTKKAAPAKKAAKATPAKKAAKATPAKKAAPAKAFPLTFLPPSVGGEPETSTEARTAQASTRVEPSLKKAFKAACRSQGVSEAAALRMGMIAMVGGKFPR